MPGNCLSEHSKKEVCLANLELSQKKSAISQKVHRLRIRRKLLVQYSIPIFALSTFPLFPFSLSLSSILVALDDQNNHNVLIAFSITLHFHNLTVNRSHTIFAHASNYIHEQTHP